MWGTYVNGIRIASTGAAPTTLKYMDTVLLPCLRENGASALAKMFPHRSFSEPATSLRNIQRLENWFAQ